MSISDKLASMTPKNRQYLVLGAAGGAVMLLATIGASMMGDGGKSNTPAPSSPEQQITNIASPGSAANPKDVWMEQSSAQMKQMNDVITDLKGQMSKMDAQSGVKQTEMVASPMPPLSPLPPLSPAPSPSQLMPPVQAGNPIDPPQPVTPKEPGIATFEVTPVAAPAADEANTNMGYIPAGTFVRVALLGGLDAPTGGQAQTNPHPMLLRAQDNAFLPNRYRFEIKECFLLASGYGDISSERALARLENISCVRNDGTAVDVNVKGYVVGEDGKAGMRGRVISKQGQVLANALLAGIGSGIGQAFQAGATTQATSPLGTISTVNPGQQAQNGISNGVGKALDRLSQYYITLAEKLFPVIEIDAGRTVEVVFTKGFSLETNHSKKLGGTYSEIWKRGSTVMGNTLDQLDAQ